MVNFNIGESHARAKSHVIQSALHGGAPLRMLLLMRIGNMSSDRLHIMRRCSPCHLRGNVRGIQSHFLIKHCILIGIQLPPVRGRRLPVFIAGGKGASFNPLFGGGIGSNQPRSRPRLNGHITNAHATRHIKGANGIARIFNHMPRAARRANRANDGKNNVFCRHAIGARPRHRDTHIARASRPQRLGGKHMLHLRCADAKRQCPKRTVRGSMRIPANNRHARLGESLLGTNHMNNAAPRIIHVKIANIILLAIMAQCLHLQTRLIILNDSFLAKERGNIVVSHCECCL